MRDGPAPRIAKTREELEPPPPGSQLARRFGCRCPVLDNAYGAGLETGLRTVFWVSGDCPVHGADLRAPDAGEPRE